VNFAPVLNCSLDFLCFCVVLYRRSEKDSKSDWQGHTWKLL